MAKDEFPRELVAALASLLAALTALADFQSKSALGRCCCFLRLARGVGSCTLRPTVTGIHPSMTFAAA